MSRETPNKDQGCIERHGKWWFVRKRYGGYVHLRVTGGDYLGRPLYNCAFPTEQEARTALHREDG